MVEVVVQEIIVLVVVVHTHLQELDARVEVVVWAVVSGCACQMQMKSHHRSHTHAMVVPQACCESGRW